MKVSIGSKIVLGPWGGGNLFAINLTNYLLDKGHEVIYNLTDSDIDLIIKAFKKVWQNLDKL